MCVWGPNQTERPLFCHKDPTAPMIQVHFIETSDTGIRELIQAKFNTSKNVKAENNVWKLVLKGWTLYYNLKHLQRSTREMKNLNTFMSKVRLAII